MYHPVARFFRIFQLTHQVRTVGGAPVQYSIVVSILFLIATTILEGCASLAACGAPPASSSDFGWAGYNACIEEHEKEKRAQAAYDAEHPEDNMNPEEIAKLREEERRQASLDAEERWSREVEEALQEASSLSPDYPQIAWLNGMWCGTDEQRPSDGIRWKVTGSNSVNHIGHSYYLPSESTTGVKMHSVRERTFFIEEKDGYFELEQRLSYEEVQTRIYHAVIRIRKDSDSAYANLYDAMFWNSDNTLWREFEPDYAKLLKCITR